MIKFTRISLAVLSVTVMAVAVAHATPPCVTCPAAPEISPELGAGAMAMIGGVVMILRGRRKV
jgi:hypothetical protein